MAHRRRRLRLVVVALGLAFAALLLTGRCERPRAAQSAPGPEWGFAPRNAAGAQGAPQTPQEQRPVLPADGRATVPTAGLVTPAERLHEARVRKCERLVATFYAGSGFLPYCETLIATHERMEREGGPALRGFGAAWYWSLVYGAANFGLQVGATAPGSCAGPMDVKHWPLVTDPAENIEWHCREMGEYYRRGVRGRDLCESVFYPAAPRDWGGGRFARTDAMFRACIARGYAVGKLP